MFMQWTANPFFARFAKTRARVTTAGSQVWSWSKEPGLGVTRYPPFSCPDYKRQ